MTQYQCLSHCSGFTLLLSFIRIKSTCPCPSSFAPAFPITCPVFTLSPLCTSVEDKLLYTVKYFPCFMNTACLSSVSYTHLRAHETDSYLVCRLLLEKK